MPELADDAYLAYGVDADGNPFPIVYGSDAYGNPVIVDKSKPWYNDLLMQGVNATQNIFGRGNSRYDRYYDGTGQPAVQVAATPSGIGAGISTNTLLIGGLVLAFFLFGRKGR